MRLCTITTATTLSVDMKADMYLIIFCQGEACFVDAFILDWLPAVLAEFVSGQADAVCQNLGICSAVPSAPPLSTTWPSGWSPRSKLCSRLLSSRTESVLVTPHVEEMWRTTTPT